MILLSVSLPLLFLMRVVVLSLLFLSEKSKDPGLLL
jgi:hypothetical protein